jgi:hypothetical protein
MVDNRKSSDEKGVMPNTIRAPSMADPGLEELSSAAAESSQRIGWWDFVSLAFQLAAVLAVAIQYRIEAERGFALLSGVIFFGFLVHAWLPARFRLQFLLVLTVIAAVVLLGPNAIWLLLVGLGLFAICNLGINWWIRVTLLLCAAAVLGVMQVGWIDARWGSVVIPVLGSIFMFRIIIYMYDLKEDTQAPVSIWQRLAYFFLFPNICFPLFPVIDYKGFLKTYYDSRASEIYQKGLYWMLRGMIHLLLYRVIYYSMPRADEDLPGVLGVYVFMAMTYALYLRVSGLFHLIIGMLCLFGFNLPQTNNNYFFAGSFTDLWRRINIYWKDFMMSVVFYPIFMRLRRVSMTYRLVIATLLVFVITWALHSYQWFWLQGVFPIRAQDVVFWGVLGVLLSVNTVYEARRGRRRLVEHASWSPLQALVASSRTVGVFSVMAILWTLWYSESVAEWWYRILRVGEGDVWSWLGLLAILGAAIGIGVLGQYWASKGWGFVQAQDFIRRRASHLVPAAALSLLFVAVLGKAPVAQGTLGKLVDRLESTELNRIDRQRQERGYYEALSRSIQLGATAVAAETDEWVNLNQTGALISTGDIRGTTLAPNIDMTFKGRPFTTNSWGMRDREYGKEKDPATYRFALLGASHVMGSGVGDEETFENLIEQELNARVSKPGIERYEILNFAVGGYGALQSLYTAEAITSAFQPDAVIYVIHPGEGERLIEGLRRSLERGVGLGPEYDDVTAILKEARVRVGIPHGEFLRRLRPYRTQLTGWVYHRLAEVVRAVGAVPVFVFLPLTDKEFASEELQRLTTQAEDAGGIVLVMKDPYEGYELEELKIAEGDNHPNALGHRLIANALYQELRDQVISKSGEIHAK